jgi:hypothetical protein
LFPAEILGLEPVGFGDVLLSAPLHTILNLQHLLNVIVQLANKMGFYKKKVSVHRTSVGVEQCADRHLS